MKKVLIFIAVCLFLLSSTAFPKDSFDFIPEGSYGSWISFVQKAWLAGPDIFIDDYAAIRGYSSSRLRVHFDSRITDPIIAKKDDKETVVLVFKNQKQYEDYVPGMVRKKIRRLDSWKNWK